MVCNVLLTTLSSECAYSIESKKAHTLFYKPYTPLESGPIPNRIQQLNHIESFVNTSQWYDARYASHVLIKEALNGLHYLQTYDRTLLRIIVTLAHIGWMLYSSLYIIRPLEIPSLSVNKGVLQLVPPVISLACGAVFLVQRSPWSYYLYVSFPAYFWYQFFRQGVPYFLLPAIRARVGSDLRRNIDRVALAVSALLALGVCSNFY